MSYSSNLKCEFCTWLSKLHRVPGSKPIFQFWESFHTSLALYVVRPFSPIAEISYSTYCCHLVCVFTWYLSSVYANIVSHAVTSFNSCTLLQFFFVNHHIKCHHVHYLTRCTCLNENVPIGVLTLGHQLVALLERFRRCSLGDESTSLGSSFESLRPQPTCHPLFLVCAFSPRSELLASYSCHHACCHAAACHYRTPGTVS